MKRLNELSPMREVAAWIGLGAALGLGGLAIEHMEDPKVNGGISTAIEVIEYGGAAAGAWGVILGLNYLGAKVVDDARREELEHIKELAAELPKNIQGIMDFKNIGRGMESLYFRSPEQTKIDPAVIRRKLMGTRSALIDSMPYSIQFEMFSHDIKRVVDNLADVRAHNPDSFKASIIEDGDEVRIRPSYRDRLEDELIQLGMFLDLTMPLKQDENGPSKERPACWYNYLDSRVGSEMVNRLLDKEVTPVETA